MLSLTTILDYGFEAKSFHTHLSSDFICHHKVWSVFFCVVCFLRELEKTTCHVHIIEHLLQPGNSNKHQDIIIFQKKAGGNIVVVAAVFCFFFFSYKRGPFILGGGNCSNEKIISNILSRFKSCLEDVSFN